MPRSIWLVVVVSLAFAGCPAADPMPPADGGARDVPPACTSDAGCDDGTFCNGAESCEGGTCVAGTPPCASAACDEAADACRCTEPDVDRDGEPSIACGGADCDDDDARRRPGATEVCDADDVDEDCRPETYGFVDLDSDGYVDATCCNVGAGGSMVCGDDCNDMRTVAHPGASEVCDGFDNDCDTNVDESVRRVFYPDADGDLYGDGARPTVMACDPPAGHVENGDDCDDDNASAHSTTDPEVCDTFDNDCDGNVDESAGVVAWYPDADGDGRGDDAATPVMSCSPVADHVTNDGDCDDAVATTFMGAPELCNDVDDDCSSGGGAIDTEDADDDLHAAMGGVCTSGRFPADDCDDTRMDVHPGVTAYFTSPIACATGSWCTGTDAMGSFACCVSPPLACAGRSMCDPGNLPNFDYDCSGAAEREPTITLVCPTFGTSCPSTTGLSYGGTPPCGSTVNRVRCRSAFPSMGCTLASTPVALGCH